MARITEPLNGGLKDGPDPSSLKPGELSYIQNAYYYPNSDALQRAKGRSLYATISATADNVVGLRTAAFDNGDQFLIAMTTGVPAYSTGYILSGQVSASATGLLTALSSPGVSLEAVQFRNRYYLFNGTTATGDVITNSVVFLSATAASQPMQVRQHGMLPVKTPPITAYSTATFSLDVVGYYDYWYTEVAKFTQDGAQMEIESTYSSSASVATVYVSATASATPALTLGAPLNGNTTHWRVYRSVRKEHAADKTFPDGFSVQTISTAVTATAQFVDTLTVTQTTQQLPTAFNSSGPYSGWTNAITLTAANNSYASGAAAVVQTSPPQLVVKYQAVNGFNFGSFQGAIRGIEVELKAYISVGSAPKSIVVQLGRRGADGGFQYMDALGGYNVQKFFPLTATSPSQTITLGSSTDRWVAPGLPGFADTDMDASFQVVIGNPNLSSTLGVDYVKVRVSYGASNTESVQQFPSVVYTFGDITAEVGKNGPPPQSSTGDTFEDTLVVNDLSNPSVFRYSAPGEPEYFPGTYFVDIETDTNDRVTCIRSVNNRLVVGLSNSIYRVNYLPSERDASFDRGKCIDPISTTYGIINPMCACVFSPDGKAQRMAWVSYKGIHITDGFSMDTITDQLNWSAILPNDGTASAIALVNDPDLKAILFLYRNPSNSFGGSEHNILLPFSYAERHVSEGGLKTGGKVFYRNKIGSNFASAMSLWSAPDSAGTTRTFIGYGGASTAAGAGTVYQVTGSTIPANDNTMAWISRRMFLAGEGSEFRLNEVYGYLGSYGSQPGIDMTALTIKTNDDAGEVTKSTKTIQYAGRKLGKWQFRESCEGLRLNPYVTGNPDNDVSWEYIILDGEDFGVEDSGK